ncbi:MAG TPA: Xaa-Pro dipeptidase [Candidatus Saccharimonadia bacterium]|nr:Xaa-Pro dipeptidase [Candidatus Saccharimonadia bacterium]
MTPHLADLYPAHLRTVQERADRALALGGYDHLVVAAGAELYKFLDDMPYPFVANPHFKAWLPLTQHPHCWLAYTPGKRPVLVYHQPADYWHLPPQDPAGYWVEHFDVRVIREPREAVQHLPKPAARCAILGDTNAALEDYAPNNPPGVVNPLHWARSRKTGYELQSMRAATARGVRAHRAAEAAFRAGKTEYEIHQDYCAAAGHNEHELPYGNIVALNQHGATLHYQHQSRVRPPRHHSLLIDAGAQVHGYACDIPRTHGDGDGEFAALVAGVDAIQQQLVAKVRPGQNYPALHIEAHLLLAQLLESLGIVRMSAEAQVETGVSSAFFPHGLGHYLGLQVHDVGGFQQDESGGTIAKPPGHPYLRLTRTLRADEVLTIEPGIYFIDMLLAELKRGRHAASVDWGRIAHLQRFGGVRIEDDVRVTDGEPENLTRNAFAELDRAA